MTCVVNVVPLSRWRFAWPLRLTKRIGRMFRHRLHRQRLFVGVGQRRPLDPHKRFYETADRVKCAPCISMVLLSFSSRGFISGFYSHSGESVGLGACWCPIVMKRCCNLTYGLVFRAKRLSAVAATRDLHPVLFDLVPYGVNTWVPFGNGR